jgi:hypothetical protein
MQEWDDEVQKVREQQKVMQDEWREQLAKGEHPLKSGGSQGGY